MLKPPAQERTRLEDLGGLHLLLMRVVTEPAALSQLVARLYGETLTMLIVETEICLYHTELLNSLLFLKTSRESAAVAGRLACTTDLMLKPQTESIMRISRTDVHALDLVG